MKFERYMTKRGCIIDLIPDSVEAKIYQQQTFMQESSTFLGTYELELKVPKKKVKKVVEGWVNIYPNNQVGGSMFSSLTEADRWAAEHRVACGFVSTTYEVEE